MTPVIGDEMDDVQADLDAYMAEAGIADEGGFDADEPLPPVEHAYEANRLLRRLRRLELDQARHDEVLAAELATLRAWHEDRSHGVGRARAHIEAALEGWMRKVHDESGGKRKTEKLPMGEVRVRPAKTKVVVVNEAQAVEGLRAAHRHDWLRPGKVTVAVSDMSDELLPGPDADLELVEVKGPAPDGYRWADAWSIGDFTPVGWMMVMPVLARVPHVLLLVPTRSTFGYTTTKTEE